MRAVVQALHPLRDRVHTPTWDNGSAFAEHARIDIALDAPATSPTRSPRGSAAAMRTPMASCASICPKAAISPP